MKTENLGLMLTSSEEWNAQKYRKFIEGLAGYQEDSALQIIDKSVGDLQKCLDDLETQLSAI